ncbi:MAG: HD domain-containing protein [Deltaproteobacteria bacterium]|nr:HD domain-containing protein [Deltaproteobacteria bacterium]
MSFLQDISKQPFLMRLEQIDLLASLPEIVALSGAPDEVERELALLFALLHDNVAPYYRPIDVTLELLALLESKSAHTARHSMRVAAVGRILAKSLTTNIVLVERISLAALLHDVGKLVIPNRILDKKSKLTFDERKCVQTHALFTDIILSAFPDFDVIREIAALHHEHLNGTGYPYGCTATGLSLAPRIIAVADIFVALTEDRPYRSGITIAAALHRLSSLAREGILDVKVVARALEMLMVHNHFDTIWRPSPIGIAVALNEL